MNSPLLWTLVGIQVALGGFDILYHHELTERLVRMEGHADEIHSAGLKAAFQAHRNGSAIEFIVQREIFKHLERIVDAFEAVANVIDGIVIDHS